MQWSHFSLQDFQSHLHVVVQRGHRCLHKVHITWFVSPPSHSCSTTIKLSSMHAQMVASHVHTSAEPQRERGLCFPFCRKLVWGELHQSVVFLRKLQNSSTSPITSCVHGFQSQQWECIEWMSTQLRICLSIKNLSLYKKISKMSLSLVCEIACSIRRLRILAQELWVTGTSNSSLARWWWFLYGLVISQVVGSLFSLRPPLPLGETPEGCLPVLGGVRCKGGWSHKCDSHLCSEGCVSPTHKLAIPTHAHIPYLPECPILTGTSRITEADLGFCLGPGMSRFWVTWRCSLWHGPGDEH